MTAARSDDLLAIERIGTGHTNADEILLGGFPARSINIIMGSPGTGKTVFAEQILFHNAGGERPVVFLSTLSEPLVKVVWHLQRFDFYDEALMLESVIYEDLGETLLQGGVEASYERLKQIIQEIGPRILVIDSFKAVHDMAESPGQMRRLTAELVSLLGAYDVTTFLVGEYGPDQLLDFPEFAAADGVIELSRNAGSVRDRRSLRVLKLRGSGYREGSHAFTITNGGLQVLPRVVTPTVPTSYEPRNERVPSGAGGLDDLLGGGLWGGSSTLLVGPAGSGKTTFGLGFAAAGVRSGEPSLFLNLQENPTQLGRTVESLGLDLPELREQGLVLEYVSPVELELDEIMLRLDQAMKGGGFRRVVIDSLGDLARVSESPHRFHDFLYALTQHLTAEGFTSLITVQGNLGRGRLDHDIGTRLSYISDVILSMDTDYEASPPQRTFQIVKGRGINHPLDKRPYHILQGGIRIGDESPE